MEKWSWPFSPSLLQYIRTVVVADGPVKVPGVKRYAFHFSSFVPPLFPVEPKKRGLWEKRKVFLPPSFPPFLFPEKENLGYGGEKREDREKREGSVG